MIRDAGRQLGVWIHLETKRSGVEVHLRVACTCKSQEDTGLPEGEC